MKGCEAADEMSQRVVAAMVVGWQTLFEVAAMDQVPAETVGEAGVV